MPAENVIGGEGQGLKIALTTLNTGRLSLPAMCVARRQVVPRRRPRSGRPSGSSGAGRSAEHEAVANKIAFIAATTYGLESMLDLCCLLADDDRNDIRIEAALVKLYASEMAWQIADELIQIRGGRGYETADSLAARGERPIAVEQMLRDLRINRIFEGSTEIMHLLIAREAVDQHLAVAGDIIDPDADLGRKAKAGAAAGGFYARWLPTLAVGEGQVAGRVRRVRSAGRRTCATSSAPPASWPARPSTAWPAGRASWSASRPSSAGSSTSAPSCSRCRPRVSGPRPSGRAGGRGAGRPVLPAGPGTGPTLFDALWHNTDARDVALAAR